MNFKEGIKGIGFIILLIYLLFVSYGFLVAFVNEYNENFFKFELGSFFNRVGTILKSTGIYLLV